MLGNELTKYALSKLPECIGIPRVPAAPTFAVAKMLRVVSVWTTAALPVEAVPSNGKTEPLVPSTMGASTIEPPRIRVAPPRQGGVPDPQNPVVLPDSLT